MARKLNLDSFMEKVKQFEQGEAVDLSSDEDLSIGIMNLISIEEHLFFTYNKTNDAKYLDILNEVREMRKVLLKRIIKEYEGEVWCISKHLLAASMRLMEVGTKALKNGKKSDAREMFKKSFELYSLFWGLNLGITGTKEIKTSSTEETRIDFTGEGVKPTVEGAASVFSKFGTIVKKAIDCCRE